MENKIAFLFLTLENPNFSDIWDNFFNGNEQYFNIYIHPKYPNKVTWHSDRIINKLKTTEWGFIVDAYLSLFKAAYKDKDNIKFITISESCLPVKPFKTMYEAMMQDSKTSYIRFNKISNYDYNARLPLSIQEQFKKNLIKHYARMCLSRYHVKKLLKSDHVKEFISINVGDEFFLSSIMPLDHIQDFAIVHDDWEYVIKITDNINKKIRKLYEEQERNKKINNTEKILLLKDEYNDLRKNPKKIIIVSDEDLDNIKNTKSFFYRKFDKNSDIRKYIYDFI
jgi:hypothetical protein